jgi:hypothetical protein
MKSFFQTVVLHAAVAAGPALAGPETLLSCADSIQPADAWSVPGATVVCHQTVAGARLGAEEFVRNPDKMVAFRNGVPVAVRPGIAAYATPGNSPVFAPGDWIETGSTGVTGELWWGRTAHQQVFAGQESYLRLTKSFALTPAQIPALRDYSMRRAMSVANRQPMVFKPGDEPFIVFQRERIVYTQHAATTIDFRGGLGGDGDIPSVKPTNARFDLQTRPVIKGVLRFDLVVDGHMRQFAIPLRADAEAEHLLARVSSEDTAAVCKGGPIPLVGTDEKTCIVPNSVSRGGGDTSKEYYDGFGAFFGDHARWVAIKFRVTVNSPSRNRLGDTGFGVLILKAQ